MAGGRRPPAGAVDVRITGRYAMLLDGRLSVEDLDDEELARCQLKDKNGKFTGRPPKVLPAELVRRMKQEYFKRGDEIFERGYAEAVTRLLKMSADPRVDDMVRYKALTYIIERVRGKTPDKVIVEPDAAWAVIASKIMVPALESIVDAEVIEDDDDGDV